MNTTIKKQVVVGDNKQEFVAIRNSPTLPTIFTDRVRHTDAGMLPGICSHPEWDQLRTVTMSWCFRIRPIVWGLPKCLAYSLLKPNSEKQPTQG